MSGGGTRGGVTNDDAGVVVPAADCGPRTGEHKLKGNTTLVWMNICGTGATCGPMETGTKAAPTMMWERVAITTLLSTAVPPHKILADGDGVVRIMTDMMTVVIIITLTLHCIGAHIKYVGQHPIWRQRWTIGFVSHHRHLVR